MTTKYFLNRTRVRRPDRVWNVSSALQRLGFLFFTAILTMSASQTSYSQTNTFPTSGSAGIGTMTPDEQLTQTGNQHFSSAGSSIYAKPATAATTNLDFFALASGTPTYGGNGAGMRLQSNANSEGFIMFSTTKVNAGTAERMRIDNNGNIGIGTNAPNANSQLHILTSAPYKQLELQSSQPNDVWGYQLLGTGGTGGRDWRMEQGRSATGEFNISDCSAGCAQRIVIQAGGNVGIGKNPEVALDVLGDIQASGIIHAKYQDVAEWVPSSEHISAGTVVVLDSTKSNQVTSSSVAYDTRVAGVVSEQPGIALGEKSETKALVATTGRVRVKVDASKGAIHIGDLLVTSDIPGVAMKSEPVNVGGVQIHRPGTLIGKALEPLEKGKGEILVLLSLQ